MPGSSIDPHLLSAKGNICSMLRRVFFVTGALALAACLAACNDSGKTAGGAAKTPAAAQVGVKTLRQETLPMTTVLPGRAEAYQTADIRPQVSGIIKEIAFKEGGEVKQGDLLYQIDDASYVAAVAQAKAALAKAEASVPSAQANLTRYERLVNSGATQIEYEKAKVTLLQAKADVESAKATLASAEIDLGHTRIAAPFEGIIDQTAFNIGNVVTANQETALTTIRQLDPIYIKVTESSMNLLRIRAAMAAAGVKSEALSFRLTLEDGRDYDQVGKLDMSQVMVSETTGSFSIRVVFPNPDHLILPGMYVRATVALAEEKGFAIPQLASSRDANGNLTALFASADNKVELRTFKTASASNNAWIVTDGIKDGDQLIISGLQSITPGMSVKPVEMQINDNGVVVAQEQSGTQTPTQPAAKQ